MKKTWYRSVNLKPLGPFTLLEMRAFVHSGEIGLCDLISNNENGDSWKPAYEWGVFELTLFPAGQEYLPGGDVDEGVREWVLLVEQRNASPVQEGPYSIQDIKQRLSSGQVSPYQHIWKTGLSGWCRIKDRPEFYTAISSRQLSSTSL
ncbi:MAG: GYF domain-containing protein [Bdellovibrio sp.]